MSISLSGLTGLVVKPVPQLDLACISACGFRPIEKQLAVNQPDTQTGSSDVWLLDPVKGIPSRFTTDPATDSNPIWSPDGTKIVFTSTREGIGNLYQKNSNGTGNEEVLLKTDNEKWVDDWTRDGKYIIYQAFAKTRWDLWVLPMTGDRQPYQFLQTEFNELQARFSPDGKWVAYSSNESGAREIYVQTFPASSGKWRVSANGGSQPEFGDAMARSSITSVATGN